MKTLKNITKTILFLAVGCTIGACNNTTKEQKNSKPIAVESKEITEDNTPWIKITHNATVQDKKQYLFSCGKMDIDKMMIQENNEEPIEVYKTTEYKFNNKGIYTIYVKFNDRTKIPEWAFADTQLNNVELPNSVRTIEEQAFFVCRNLNNIVIPNSVKTIEKNAFGGCEKFTTITIPESVTYIENNILQACTALNTIFVEKNNTVYDSRNNCNAIIETATNKLIAGCKNTTIPNTVTEIGEEAFSGVLMKSITIPSAVNTIGMFAFSACEALKEIKSLAMTAPQLNAGVFMKCSKKGKLYIPSRATGYEAWMEQLGSGWVIQYL